MDETNQSPRLKDARDNETDWGVILFFIVSALALIAYFMFEVKAPTDDAPFHLVESVEFMEDAMPDVINMEQPTIRIETSEGALLLTRSELGFEMAEDDIFKVIETGDFYQSNGESLLRMAPYTLYVPTDKAEALRERYTDNYGEAPSIRKADNE